MVIITELTQDAPGPQSDVLASPPRKEKERKVCTRPPTRKKKELVLESSAKSYKA